MKEKRGFTLIELLAVIVILAIIALIATPIVLSLIDKARHGAAEDSAYGVRKEAQLLYQTTMMGRAGAFNKIEVDFSKTMEKDGKTYVETKFYENASSAGETNKVFFEADGTMPTNGKITINGDGTINYEILTINSFYCCIPAQGNVNCAKENNFDGNCNSSGSGSSTPDPTTPSTDPTTPDPAPTTPSTDLATVPSGCPSVSITPSLATASSYRTVIIDFTGKTNGQYKKDDGEWVSATDDFVSVGFDANGTVTVKSDGCTDGTTITVNNITPEILPTAALSYSVGNSSIASGFFLTGPLTITLSCTPNTNLESHYIKIYDASASTDSLKRTYADSLSVTYDPSTDTYTDGAIGVQGVCVYSDGHEIMAPVGIFFYAPVPDEYSPTCDSNVQWCGNPRDNIYQANCGLNSDYYQCTDQIISDCTCDWYDSECKESTAACIYASANDPIVTPTNAKKEDMCNKMQQAACESLALAEYALCVQYYRDYCVQGCNNMLIGDDEKTKCINTCNTTTWPPCQLETCECPIYTSNLYVAP